MIKRKNDTNSLELAGLRVNALLVIERTDKKRANHILWKCKCDCGKEHLVKASILKIGKIKSCGCITKSIISEARTKHGHAVVNTETYNAWLSMLRRCNDKNHKSYSYYGGDGVKVCDEWADFSKFLRDMGHRPKGMTLDRINNDLGYSKENCRWATPKQQANNRKNNKFLFYDGEKLTLSQWAEKKGIPRDTLNLRLKRGWSIDRALNESVFHGKGLSRANEVRLALLTERKRRV